MSILKKDILKKTFLQFVGEPEQSSLNGHQSKELR